MLNRDAQHQATQRCALAHYTTELHEADRPAPPIIDRSHLHAAISLNDEIAELQASDAAIRASLR